MSDDVGYINVLMKELSLYEVQRYTSDKYKPCHGARYWLTHKNNIIEIKDGGFGQLQISQVSNNVFPDW